ncbi:unnamed protein product [Notodromas monacha]|uniref:Large ribosomal subunit protein mL46 N-terminal domain-containing protein n=1 Tax=Notodromas monacha TaxID=399045 RepID=A0A7R9BE58_9CRUS|nr:unnamed protein product [Notodromas monacha]CAG0912482.1 unnamed protein product [Notodromas monacha]
MWSMIVRQSTWCVRNRAAQLRQCATSAETSRRYDLFAAICVERAPLLSPALTKLEQTVQHCLQKMDAERSLRCDHEMKADLEKRSKGKKSEEEEVKLVTVQELEDSWMDNAKDFKTEARDGKLERPLYLVAKSVGRVLSDCIGDGKGKNWQVQVLGNAPASVYTFKYPTPVAQKANSVGGKIFFYKGIFSSPTGHDLSDEALLHKDQPRSSEIQELRWVTCDELKELLPEKYWKSVHVLIPPEE